MKYFIFLVLLSTSYASNANNNPELESFLIEQEEGEINKRGPKGKKQGPWVIFGKDKPEKGYPENGKIEEGPYKDDRREGQWTKYHKDGVTPRLVGEYSMGRPKGAYKKIWPNGQVKEEGKFVNGKQNGTKTVYYEDGTIAQKKSFNENGKEEGVQQYFHKNGQLEFEFTKSNGKNTGTATRYLDNGKVKEVITYGPDGKVLKKELINVEEPTKVENGSGGPTGIGAETMGIPFKKDGYNKTYNKDKELHMDGKFKNGKFWEGKLYKYDSDGILLKFEIWKNGKYHSDGQL